MTRREPPDPALLALNAATLQTQAGLRQIIEACARHAFQGLGLWHAQLCEPGRQQSTRQTVRDTARQLRDHGLVLTSLGLASQMPALERKPRREAIEQVRRAIDDAVELSAQCLLLNVGGLPQGSRDLQGARDMVRDALGELLEQARSAGIALAIEPLHPLFCAERSCITTLTQANDLCQELAGASGGGVGVVVDVWQHWWDPALPAQIRRAGEAQRLLLYQIADWLAHAADSALTTTGRGMMGDGVIDLPLLRSWMEAAEYRGQHEVEVVSPMDWALRDIDEVLITARRRHQECS